MQQGDGTFQARGTGVYEDLPCGLVRDCKIRRLREVSPFYSLKKIDVSALCGTLGMKCTYFSRASPPEFRAARNHQFSFQFFFSLARRTLPKRDYSYCKKFVVFPVSGELLLILR